MIQLKESLTSLLLGFFFCYLSLRIAVRTLGRKFETIYMLERTSVCV